MMVLLFPCIASQWFLWNLFKTEWRPNLLCLGKVVVLAVLIYSTISTSHYLLVYSNGNQQVLLCLTGTIPVQYKGNYSYICIIFGYLAEWILSCSWFHFRCRSVDGMIWLACVTFQSTTLLLLYAIIIENLGCLHVRINLLLTWGVLLHCHFLIQYTEQEF